MDPLALKPLRPIKVGYQWPLASLEGAFAVLD